MKKTVVFPDNLQRNLLSTLKFYKNIFNYKTVLIISKENGSLVPQIQTDKNSYKSISVGQNEFNLTDTLLLRNNSSENVTVARIGDHFSVNAMFPINKKSFLAVNSSDKSLSEEEIKIGRFFAQYIENLQKNEELVGSLESYSKRMQQMLYEISTLHEITRALDSGKSLDSLLQYIMEKCQIIMNAEAASLMLVIEETNELEFKIVLGPKSEEVKPFRLPMGKGISGWVAQTGKTSLDTRCLCRRQV